jgi:menaquinol-cytochrome c reductase iron-sulfur subunit
MRAKEVTADNLMTLATEPEPVSRRSFTVRAIYGLASTIGLALSAPAAMYIFATPKSKKQTGWVDAGNIADLNPGSPQQIPVLRLRVDGWKIQTEKDTAWIVKNKDGSLTAFSPRCTHLGCAYRWEMTADKFVCPCHGSTFSIRGEVISGPASRPLDRIQIKIEGNRLWLGDLEAKDRSKQDTGHALSSRVV